MSKPKTYRSEKDVKKEVKRLLDKHGWFWWMPAANGYGRAGIADFNAIWSGVFLAVETKFGKNTPTVMQKAYLTSVQSENGMAFIVDESRIEAFEGWLEAFKRSTDRAHAGQPESQEDSIILINCLREMTRDFV